jgi:hypothetical protein
MYRCPTCIAVLVEPRSRRCETCGQNLRRRHPFVLGESERLSARPLPIDRWMADRTGTGRPRTVAAPIVVRHAPKETPAPAPVAVTVAAPAPRPPAPPVPPAPPAPPVVEAPVIIEVPVAEIPVVETAPVATSPVVAEPAAPEVPEFVTLSVPASARRHLDPRVLLVPSADDPTTDELARAAREEILEASARRVRAHAADREPMATEGPWLAPLRKAWEPPAEPEPKRRRRGR